MFITGIRLLALSTLLVFYSPCTLAESPNITSGFFVGSDFGFAFREDTAARYNGALAYYNFNTGYRGDLHLGYRFVNGLLLELDPGYIYNSVANTSGDVELEQVPVLLNLKYQLPLGGPLKPFVGIGAGAAFSWLNVSPASTGFHDVTTFAWQAEAGVQYAISDQLALGLGYKCFSTGNLEFGTVGLNSMLTHCVQMSITFRL